jgi:hypothetical protein
MFTEEETQQLYGQEQTLLREAGKVCIFSMFDLLTIGFDFLTDSSPLRTRRASALVQWIPYIQWHQVV